MRKTFTLLTILFSINAFSAEKRIKVGIVDTGISVKQAKSNLICSEGLYNFDKTTPFDTNGHGTNIFSLVSKNLNPSTHCIISYKFYNGEGDTKTLYKLIKSIRQATKDGVTYLNLSLDGRSADFLEKKAIEEALSKNIKIFVSAGNKHENLDINCDFYPACYKNNEKLYKNMYVVGSSTGNYSNYGSIVDFYVDGTDKGEPKMRGTSQSTAIVTNKFILKKM